MLPKLIEGTDVLEPYRAFRFRGLVLVNLKLGVGVCCPTR